LQVCRRGPLPKSSPLKMTKPTVEARAFWIAEPKRGEIRSETLRAPAPDEALVRMRAPFQAGEFPAPVKYGYSNVGVVEQGPPALAGRRVFCLYPHQTRYVVPVAALHAVPDDVPPARAVLAVNVLWDAAPRVGDRIAVVGAGTVGCVVAWLAARIIGAEVELVDIDEHKD